MSLNENDFSDILTRELLVKISQSRMPFGRYKDCLLVSVPEHYLLWLSRQGFPEGELGKMLRIVYEIKVNGLEDLIHSIRGRKY